MKFFSLVCLLILMGCILGCTPSKKSITTFSGNAMTINFKIAVGSPLTTSQQANVQRVIRETFEEVDLHYNCWNPKSELSKLNQLPANSPAPLSPKLEHLLHLTQQIVLLSGGRFDPTIQPLQKLWKKELAFGREPSQTEIEVLKPAIGWDKIDFGSGYFVKADARTSLDLGGIAKGYCVDLLTERIADLGFSSIFVEWGGEIRAQGEHPDKRPWTIYISNLEDSQPDKAIATVSLKDTAIATSGDYLQNWRVIDPQTGLTSQYFHIFDPTTLRPLKVTPHSIASASVKASTCTLADGLATVAMLFPSVEEAERWLASIPDIEFWIKAR